MKILVTGATGLIGRYLIHRLLISGNEVRALARSPEKLTELPEKNVFKWTANQDVPPEALVNCDAVVHLAGEGIADKYWTENRKKQLRSSRIDSTRCLVQSIAKLPLGQRPKVLVSGSAIGFYGKVCQYPNENSPPGSDFLAELCQAWEKEASVAEDHQVRTVLLRTGLVLSRQGGILEKSGPIILGHGQQWMSWIHIEDLVIFILFSLQNASLRGAFNLTSPNPVTNKEFTQCLSQFKGYPLTLRAPTWAIKLALGEMAQAVLADQKLGPNKPIASGFSFQFDTLAKSFEDLLGGLSFYDNIFSANQFIPKPRKEVFTFFAKAENLESITPPWLNFHILKKSSPEISEGCIIDYQLRLHGLALKWRTLISAWQPDDLFIDDQIKGPYKKWHHTHRFEEVPGGTLISDEVIFQIPAGIFGKLVKPFILKDIRSIFEFRQKKIKEIFL